MKSFREEYVRQSDEFSREIAGLRQRLTERPLVLYGAAL